MQAFFTFILFLSLSSSLSLSLAYLFSLSLSMQALFNRFLSVMIQRQHTHCVLVKSMEKIRWKTTFISNKMENNIHYIFSIDFTSTHCHLI